MKEAWGERIPDGRLYNFTQVCEHNGLDVSGYIGQLNDTLILYNDQYPDNVLSVADFMNWIVDPGVLTLYTNRSELPGDFSVETLALHIADCGDNSVMNSKLILPTEVLDMLKYIQLPPAPRPSSPPSSDPDDSQHLSDTSDKGDDTHAPTAPHIREQQQTMFQAMAPPSEITATNNFVKEFGELDATIPGYTDNTDYENFNPQERSAFSDSLTKWLSDKQDGGALWRTIKRKILLDPDTDTSAYDVQTWRNALDMWCAFLGSSETVRKNFDPRKSAFNFEADGRPAMYNDKDANMMKDMVGMLLCHTLCRAPVAGCSACA